VLGGNPFLVILVDLDAVEPVGAQGDLQCELGRSQVKLRSLLGYVPLPYPRSWLIQLDRTQVEAWWGAWEPFLWISLGLLLVSLWISLWTCVATGLATLLRLTIFFLDRRGSWCVCWRLTLAAQLPGALWLAVTIILYGLHQLDLIAFLFAACLHVFIAGIYLVCALGLLPYTTTAQHRAPNPFRVLSEKEESEAQKPTATP
jgi:hypothetical protein